MQSRWASASSSGFPENSGLNETSFSVLFAVPAMQVGHDVPVAVGLVVLPVLELGGGWRAGTPCTCPAMSYL